MKTPPKLVDAPGNAGGHCTLGSEDGKMSFYSHVVLQNIWHARNKSTLASLFFLSKFI